MGADPISSVVPHPPRRIDEPPRAGSFSVPSRHCALKAISVFPPRLRTLTSLSRHKHCGSPTYGQWPIFGTVQADLLMSLHRQRPVELFGPLPSTAPADGAALQPPVGNQQA